MKKLDQLLIKSYLGPLILTFFIALFVLDMMFLWKYVDDLIGKGVETNVILELMFYASAVQVPMAIPLSVLVASIMTFGNFGEQFELTAIKSSGISLFRFMRPLIIFTIMMSGASFYFSNNILPVATLKYKSLLNDLRKQKPALAFTEKMFNKDIDKFVIRIDGKKDDDKTVYGVLIYDHTDNKGNNHVITADSAEIGYLNDGAIMTIALSNGHQYKEETMPVEKDKPAKYVITNYEFWEKHFDLSDFKLDRTDESDYSKMHAMLNLKQLKNGKDTVHLDMQAEHQLLMENLSRYYLFLNKEKDSSGIYNQTLLNVNFYTKFDSLSNTDKSKLYKSAVVKANNIKNILISKKEILGYKNRDLIQYDVYMHQKFTLSVACLVLFFIGAPLGAIIKKGGFGWPMLLAVIFFVIYIVTSIIGEKTSEQMVVKVWQGMWLSTFLLLPIGLFLTWKAKNDSPLFTSDFYLKFLNKIKRDA